MVQFYFYRSPFLDDLFVEWVTSLPLECRTDFTQPRGVGEKWLIREALKVGYVITIIQYSMCIFSLRIFLVTGNTTDIMPYSQTCYAIWYENSKIGKSKGKGKRRLSQTFRKMNPIILLSGDSLKLVSFFYTNNSLEFKEILTTYAFKTRI